MQPNAQQTAQEPAQAAHEALWRLVARLSRKRWLDGGECSRLRSAVHREVDRVARDGDGWELVALAESMLVDFASPAVPTDVELERQAVGCLVLEPANADLGLLAAGDFHDPFHAVAFRAVQTLRRERNKIEACDPALVASEIKELMVEVSGNADLCVRFAAPADVPTMLAEIVQSVAVAHHYKWYARRLRQVSLNRRRYEVASGLLRDALLGTDVVAWLKAAKDGLTKMADDVRRFRKDFPEANGA